MTVRLRHRLEYVVARAFAAVVARVPEGLAYFLARRGGDLLHLVDRRHVRIGRENVRARYRSDDGSAPSEAEVRRIVRGTFRHLVSIGVEVVRLPRTVARRGIEGIVDLVDTENMRAAMDRGKGAIVRKENNSTCVLIRITPMPLMV